MTTAALSKPKAGRPKGSKTEQLPIVDFVLPQCSSVNPQNELDTTM